MAATVVRGKWVAIGWPLLSLALLLAAALLSPQSLRAPWACYVVELALAFPNIYLIRAIVRHQLGTAAAIALLAATNLLSLAVFALCIVAANAVALAGDTAQAAIGFADAVYFSVVTWTTLGYGDILPRSDFRLFAAIEAIYGYVSLGVLVGLVSGVVGNERP